MIVLLLGTLGLVFFISFRIQKLQFTTALMLFMVYAGAARRDADADLPGLHRRLDHPGVLHLGGLVRRAVACGATPRSAISSGMGSFLIMGLFGIIIASLVNIFLKSSGLDFVISAVGVLVFAGLTAWDTQKIKEMYDARTTATRPAARP